MIAAILSLALLGTAGADVEAREQRDTLLYVATSPAGAEVLLDGKPVGTADGLFAIEPGVRRVVVELDGHDRQGKQVTIRAGDIKRLKLKLTRRTEKEVSKEAVSPKSTTAASRRVFIPDEVTLQVNPKAKVVLDLATGELLPVKEGRPGEYRSFAQLGKSDLAYDRKLRSLRGARAGRIDGTPVVGRGADQYQNIIGSGRPPYRRIITTPEGRQFDVTVLYDENDVGLTLEYRPADPAVRSPDQGRSGRGTVTKPRK